MREYITSRQNKTVVKIFKLSEKKNRETDRMFRFDGIKLYYEAVSSGIVPVYVLLRESNIDTVEQSLAKLGGDLSCTDETRVIVLSDNVFDSVTEEKSPEGIITVAKYIDKFHKIATIDIITSENDSFTVSEKERILLLEDIRDPGNLGTIIRTAAALGVDKLILCGECADIYNSKTVRASMGAIFRLPTLTCRDGEAAVRALKSVGRRVYAAALSEKSVPLGNIDIRENDCIAIGNEGHGLSKEIISVCDACLLIPMAAGTESLNAASAATVFMWEIVRPR